MQILNIYFQILNLVEKSSWIIREKLLLLPVRKCNKIVGNVSVEVLTAPNMLHEYNFEENGLPMPALS